MTNQRGSILAVLQQGDQLVARADLPVVVDRQPPRIVHARIEHADRCPAGTPLLVVAEPDDAGLAGVVQVEGAWSLDGQLQWHDRLQPILGTLRSDGTWALALPTEAIPAGDHHLLLRAADAAGNVSATYHLSVHLHSQQELDDMVAQARTVLTGALMFAAIPQSGLKVELLELPPSDQPPSTAAPPTAAGQASAPADLKVIATTRSGSDGSFRLSDVRSGTYRVRVSGNVRGMRIERQRELTVEAPKPVPPLIWRLDKQP